MTTKPKRARRAPETSTETCDAEEFLEELTGGPLTFGEMLWAIRQCEEWTQAEFARKAWHFSGARL